MRFVHVVAPAQIPFLLAAAVLPAPLIGQAPGSGAGEPPPRLHAGLAAAVAQPLGEFREYVSVGGGIHAFFRVDLDGAGLVALRVHGGFLNYGNETRRVCLSETVGCRIEVDLTTSNNIILLGVGPEIGIPVGRVRVYGNGAVGLGYFSTDSRVSGSSQDSPFATTRNYSDGGLSWSAGGGLEIPVVRAKQVSVSLDLGLSYQGNGRREYLTRGGITDRPDGSIELDVKRSDANFVVWRVGASVGFGAEGR